MKRSTKIYLIGVVQGMTLGLTIGWFVITVT